MLRVDVYLDLGFHVVIGVGRLIVQRDGFYTSAAFHHANVIPSANFFPSECCSPIVSCHRQLNLYPTFLHVSHRENGSFEVLSLQCSHCVKGLARDWPHRSDCGAPPDIPMVAMDFCFVNTDSDDDVLTVLAMKGKPSQSVGATVLPDKSASELAVATIIGYLDFWGHQEVMIKCDKEKSMKRIAELLQERRRPRRTIVEYSPVGSHESNGVVENTHYHLEGLLRTMRSDLVEKTGVNVNVKSLLAPWLVRHCAWNLTRFAIHADGQTAFKRQRQRPCWRNGVLWRSHLLPNPTSNPNQSGTKMGSR